MLGLVSLHFQCDILAPITVLLCAGQLLTASLRLTGGPQQVADLLVADATLPYYFAPRNLLPASTSRAGGFPAVGLLVDLLPVGLLVGEVAAGLAAIVLLHARKLIYPPFLLERFC